MREYQIIVKPYELLDLLELEINKEVNEHATAKVVGHISEKLHNKYTKMADNNEWLTIIAVDEEKNETILFKGIVQEAQEAIKNDVRTLKIEALSGSCLADIETKIRTFQDGSQTYDDIFTRIKEEENQNCEDDAILNINTVVGYENPINEFIVQYNETNWEFAKRLASHWNSVLVSEYKQDGCKFHFGKPDLGSIETSDANDYTVKKDMNEYRYKTEYGVSGFSEVDAICFKITTREIYDLCEEVNFQNKTLHVSAIHSVLEHAELMHTYSLKTESGLKVPKYYNFKIIGASLSAKIIEVEKDNVKVNIEVDNGKSKSLNRWYPYSTVYSSPDGTGWYFMPEENDSVRVYFPNEKENDTFIISAVHEQVQEVRSNPDNKSISTKYGKKINFNPENIEIISGENMYIKIVDDEGIHIKSDKSITFEADEDIVFSSGQNLYMTAEKGIVMEKGTSSGEASESASSESRNGKIEINEKKEIILSGKVIKINK